MYLPVQKLSQLETGKANLKDSYVSIKNGEAYVYNMHISPYEHGNIQNKNPLRNRKLLLNKREINKLIRNDSTKRVFFDSYFSLF